MFSLGTVSNSGSYNIVKGYTTSFTIYRNAYISNTGTHSLSITGTFPTYSVIATQSNGNVIFSFGTQSNYDTIGGQYSGSLIYTDANDSRTDGISINIVNNTVSTTQIATISRTVPYDIEYVNFNDYNTVQYGTISYNLVSTHSNMYMVYSEVYPFTSSTPYKTLYLGYLNTQNTVYYLNELYHTQSVVYTATNELNTYTSTHSFVIEYNNIYYLEKISAVTISTMYSPINVYTYSIQNNFNVGPNPVYFESVTGLPAFATYQNLVDINDSLVGNIIIGTTSNSAIGTHSFTYSISNYTYTITETANIIVTNNPSYSIVESPELIRLSTYGGFSYSYNLASHYTGIDVRIEKIILPSWMTYSNGYISGFPTTSDIGTKFVTYSVTNNFNTLQKAVRMEVLDNTLFETIPLVPQHTIGGQYFSYSINSNYTTATGSITTNVISIPDWLTYQNGIISGTSTISDIGDNNFQYTVSNGFRTFNRRLQIIVIDNPVTKVSSIPNQITYVGVTYSFYIKNYYQTYTSSLSVTNYVLPNWLTASGFTVSGIATSSNIGTHSIGFTISNGFKSLYDSYQVQVKNPAIAKTGTQSIRNSVIGVYFTGSILLNKYTSPYGTISISTYSFPNWLSYNPSSSIYSGTPSATGSTIAYVTLTNGLSTYLDTLTFVTKDSELLKIKYHNPVSINTDTFFEYIIRTDEYSTNYGTISIATVSKPSWLTYYDSNYTLGGIPTASHIGTWSVTYSVTNGRNSLNDYVYIQVNEGFSVDLVPAAFDVKFKHINSISCNINWTRPVYAQTLYSIVVITDGGATLSYPIRTNYIGNTNIENAVFLDKNEDCTGLISATSSDWKVIYNGIGTDVTAINLKPESEYRVAIFNYIVANNKISTCGTIVYKFETGNFKETNNLRFTIISSITNKHLSEATITVYDRFNDVVSICTTDDLGHAQSLELETETNYKIVVEKLGYIRYEKTFYNRKDFIDYANDRRSIGKWDSRGRVLGNKGGDFLRSNNEIAIYLIKSV